MFDKSLARTIAVLLGAVLCSGCASKPMSSDTPPKAADAEMADYADRFYFDHCPLCATRFGVRGEAIEVMHGERELRFCSPSCVEAFHHNPAAGLRRIDAEMIADQRPFYPLKHSLYSAESLPDRPIEFIWGNRLFRARNEEERRRILADPADAIVRLDRAVIDAQRPTYGMPDKCPVQGDILSSEQRIDIVVANRMIRLCCRRCVRVVRARPYQYLAMVEYANRAEAERRDLMDR